MPAAPFVKHFSSACSCQERSIVWSTNSYKFQKNLQAGVLTETWEFPEISPEGKPSKDPSPSMSLNQGVRRSSRAGIKPAYHAGQRPRQGRPGFMPACILRPNSIACPPPLQVKEGAVSDRRSIICLNPKGTGKNHTNRNALPPPLARQQQLLGLTANQYRQE